MPPRGSEGYDFNPILTHYVFLVTTILAVLGWFIAFIGQAIATAKFTNGAVGVLWFAIWLELALIAAVILTLATDAIAMHRFQISTFGAVAIVFSVIGVNEGILSSQGSLIAMGVGWLLLSFVNIIWVLYFTSEEDSLILHIFNYFGTGGLTPPSRRSGRRHARTSSSGHGIQGNGTYGYQGGGFGGGISSTGGGYDTKDPVESGGSIGRTDLNRDAGTGTPGMRSNPNLATATAGTGAPDSAPLMGGMPASNPLAAEERPNSQGGEGAENYLYRAKALYAYQASAEDPNEISFAKGEILDILDKSGKWWQARKSDGTAGIAPSNYLHII